MTTPSVVPAKYTGDSYPWLRAKVDRDGCVRSVATSVTVPAATAQDAYIGLVPFQAGARFILDSTSIYCADLDTSTNVTLDVGIIYDDHANNTNNATAFASASTAPQTAGFVSIDEIAGMTLVTTGNGWLVAQVNAATTTEGAITARVMVCYDK